MRALIRLYLNTCVKNDFTLSIAIRSRGSYRQKKKRSARQDWAPGRRRITFKRYEGANKLGRHSADAVSCAFSARVGLVSSSITDFEPKGVKDNVTNCARLQPPLQTDGEMRQCSTRKKIADVIEYCARTGGEKVPRRDRDCLSHSDGRRNAPLSLRSIGDHPRGPLVRFEFFGFAELA
jgi:hypothetical protein